jgi:uncharacterized membrane protein
VTGVRSVSEATVTPPPNAAVPTAAAPTAARPRRTSRRDLSSFAMVLLILVCGGVMALGYLNKDRCTGPTFDQFGRTMPATMLRAYRDVCYSDIQYLWVGRDIDQHVFPYVNGGISDDGQLFGGTVEYPVLTGMLMWLGAMFAHNDHQFLLYSSILLAPFGFAVAWLLGKLARWRALLWAVGPPLVLYAFHNWDLAVVACAVGAAYVVHRGWGRAGANRPLVTRATAAAVLLGIGFSFKLYPAIFTLPLMLYVATGGPGGRELPARLELSARRRVDLLGAARVGLTAIATAIAVNLPFVLAGYEGWKASFTFQELRAVDITTNSIWFWGFRPFSDPGNRGFQHLVDVLSPTLILLSFAVACYVGWLRYRRTGTYPWLAVSAAMLCGFLLFHKVHSPQYVLWLVPMFVLLRLRPVWIVLYLLADLAMGIGVFRYFYAISFHQPYGIYDGLAAQLTTVGVWGRAALLAVLFFVFLTTQSTVDDDDLAVSGSYRPAMGYV